jgi:large subunit ribosomal protein L22
MTGPKTNLGQRSKADEIGTSAHLNTARFSAWKARVVLDLIRGKDVRSADQTLQLTQRDAAGVIRKLLASAVANAVNNDSQIADELFVSACFADEGPTLKRFRPRAKGRGMRIHKRTCHITVVVKRLDDDIIERMRAAEESSGRQSATSSRAARVARSRQAAAVEGSEVEAVEAEVVEIEAAETEAETEAVAAEAPYGDGSAAPLEDGSAPAGYDIKGNADSMKFHTPESPWYGRTKAEVWFNSAEAAEAAGFVNALAAKDDAADDAADAGEDA